MCISNPYVISIYLYNLKQSGDRYYPITWIHRTIDPSTERCLSPSVWSKWSMRGFQGIWALNASWPELQWRGPLLPVFRWKLWTCENQIHESYQSQGNTKPFNLLMCSLKLENNWAVSFIPFKMACRKPQVPRGLPQSFRDHSRSFRECFL